MSCTIINRIKMISVYSLVQCTFLLSSQLKIIMCKSGLVCVCVFFFPNKYRFWRKKKVSKNRKMEKENPLIYRTNPKNRNFDLKKKDEALIICMTKPLYFDRSWTMLGTMVGGRVVDQNIYFICGADKRRLNGYDCI